MAALGGMKPIGNVSVSDFDFSGLEKSLDSINTNQKYIMALLAVIALILLIKD